MEKMPGAFIPEKAQGVDSVVQFKFTGAEAGDWVAVIKDGKVDVSRGTHPVPNMTLTADSQDYVKIFSGTYSSIFNAAPLLVVWQNREWRNWFRRPNQAQA
jgi:putative sterol carrier protein